jgi:hypothetical protein
VDWLEANYRPCQLHIHSHVTCGGEGHKQQLDKLRELLQRNPDVTLSAAAHPKLDAYNTQVPDLDGSRGAPKVGRLQQLQLC